MARVFGLGCGAAFLVTWVRPWADAWTHALAEEERNLADAFLITAPLEESLKLLAILLGACVLKRQMGDPLDGILYGAAAALGFASVENVYYLVDSGDPGVVLARGFTSTLAHVGFTGFLGFALGLARTQVRGSKALLIGFAWVAAVTFHGAYNFLLAQGRHYAWVALLLVLPVSLIILAVKVREARPGTCRLPLP